MRKLLCLLLTIMLLPVTVWAESAVLSIDTPAEAIRPGKAFLLSFSVPEDGLCDLTLRDMAGSFVMEVVRELQVCAGVNQMWWNGTSQGVAPAEGVYQLALTMNGQEAASTVVIGSQAPYLTSIVATPDAEAMALTVDFYASGDGLLTVGMWNGNVWSLIENRQVAGGMNRIVWDAADITEATTALTLTLTDATGFSSNEEHISVTPADFGITYATIVPLVELTPTPAPVIPEVEATEAPIIPEADESFEAPIDLEVADEPAAPEEEATEAPVIPEADESFEAPIDLEAADAPVIPEAEATEAPAVPEEEATPAPNEFVLTPPDALFATPIPEEEPAEEEPAEDFEDVIDLEAAEGFDEAIDLELHEAEEADAAPTATPVPLAATPEDIVFTPSYGSPYPLTEADAGTYWGTPMDITDEEAIWTMLTSPITYYDAAHNVQRKIYAEPDEDSRQIAVITGSSQGVRVIEELDNGWSLIETYSSTFHDNSVDAWNMLIQGYVKTSKLKTKKVDKKYHIIVDKLTQRLYLFGEGKLLTTLLVSTGLSNETQPYNETRSGDFLYCSPSGGFWSDNMFAPLGMKFNDGDLLHEVPYVQRKGSKSKIYSTTEPFLGQRASHGCIRVQRKKNADGYNMQWIWDNRKDLGRIVVWEDWQGRQIAYPADDTVLYYNANGGEYYHKEDHCESAKDHITFTPFTYAELDTGAFAELDFCPYCAPAMRKAEIAKVNEAHAWGGDHDPILTAARQKWLNKVIDKYGYEALTDAEKRYYQGDAQ